MAADTWSGADPCHVLPVVGSRDPSRPRNFDQRSYLATASTQTLTCPSRIRGQAATGSWTKSLQWETQRTWFKSAGTTPCRLAKVSGVWPSNEAWLRAAL